MSQLSIPCDPTTLDASADLQTILAAWHTATLRLEQTHNALRDEVQQLTAELEIKNRELARKNRLADLGQMASHVAHEVRNNLVPVTLYLSMLRRRMAGDAEGLDMLAKVNAGFRAMDVMVNDLLHFTSDRDPQVTLVSLRKLVAGIEASLAPQLAAQKIRFELAVSPQHTLRADGEMLRRAVLNLVLNALDAMPDGGTLTVGTTADPRPAGHPLAGRCPGYPANGLELYVADSGPGLPADVLPRVFEPFFTTKPSGTGLGLAIVSRIAEAHGGTATAANSREGGAVFTLHLPSPDHAAYGAQRGAGGKGALQAGAAKVGFTGANSPHPGPLPEGEGDYAKEAA
jgi:signal transduction histidine kinase